MLSTGHVPTCCSQQSIAVCAPLRFTTTATRLDSLTCRWGCCSEVSSCSIHSAGDGALVVCPGSNGLGQDRGGRRGEPIDGSPKRDLASTARSRGRNNSRHSDARDAHAKEQDV